MSLNTSSSLVLPYSQITEHWGCCVHWVLHVPYHPSPAEATLLLDLPQTEFCRPSHTLSPSCFVPHSAAPSLTILTRPYHLPLTVVMEICCPCCLAFPPLLSDEIKETEEDQCRSHSSKPQHSKYTQSHWCFHLTSLSLLPPLPEGTWARTQEVLNIYGQYTDPYTWLGKKCVYWVKVYTDNFFCKWNHKYSYRHNLFGVQFFTFPKITSS